MSSVIEFIGRFHPVLVHLPIGVLITSLLLQWLSRKQSYGISHNVIKLVLFFGMAGALLSCITGWLLSMSGDYNESLVSWHMWMGIAVAFSSLLVFMKVARHELDNVYKILSIVLLLLITVTGHLGGSLTHGSGYLTDALTAEPDSAVNMQKPIINIQEAKVYEEVINPIFQSKCYSCHGAKKQKGKLRMDSPELLMKGGKDGVVIVPSNPAESELLKRLLLPETDDDHMPPKEKPQLNEKQIALLHWWIEQGADLNKKVKELTKPEKIASYLLALQSDNVKEEKKALPDVPLMPVEKADEKAISALQNKGIVVLPVAMNSNYLLANFVTASQTNDRDIALLLPLKKQLVWLKLGNTMIGDSALSFIGQCYTLRTLHLNNTNISDRGLAFLTSLDSLKSLNLVGTKVTSDGIMQLKSLKKLLSMYLYQTGIRQQDWVKLKNAFPNVVLDSGGYVVPSLQTDTMIVKPPKVNKQ